MPEQDRQETGTSLMVIGWILALVALMVMFFQPGYVGRKGMALVAGSLFLAAIVVNLVGYRIRQRAR